MQNMAEGLGVGTKQLQAAEKEYRIGEKARQESVGVLKQAQRAEVLGNQKEAANSYEKYEGLMEKQQESKRKTAEHLLTTATQQEQIIATKEAGLANAKAIKDASIASTNAYHAMTQEQATARLEETKRRNDQQDATTKRALYEKAFEKHPNYNALRDLGQTISNLQSTPNLPAPQQAILKEKITQFNSIQKAIHEAAGATAQREFSVGNTGFSNFKVSP
jgi:hypothetical protein